MISIKEAVINVLSRVQPGDKLLAYHIENLVRGELKRNYYPGVPQQETIQRKYREVADLCEMETTSEGFVKRIPLPPITEDEREAKQKMLF